MMSALNNPSNLNIAQGLEYQGRARTRPPVALTSRTIMPSFMPSSLSVGQSENLTIPIPVTGLSSGYGTLTAKQSFNSLSNIQTSPWDNGQIVFHNYSFTNPDDSTQLIIGHPQVQLMDGTGRIYPSGVLQQSFNHQGLGAQIIVPVYSPTMTAPASISMNLTGMLLGMAVNH